VRHRHTHTLATSVRCAARGLWHVLQTERNSRIHVAIGVAVVLLSIWLGLAPLEWALIIISITLVFAGEMLNTVVERLVDLSIATPHPLAGQAKDIAAGAVLFAALTAIAIGLLVLGPPLWARLSAL
jgi:diacylglycerol kinase